MPQHEIRLQVRYKHSSQTRQDDISYILHSQACYIFAFFPVSNSELTLSEKGEERYERIDSTSLMKHTPSNHLPILSPVDSFSWSNRFVPAVVLAACFAFGGPSALGEVEGAVAVVVGVAVGVVAALEGCSSLLSEEQIVGLAPVSSASPASDLWLSSWF